MIKDITGYEGLYACDIYGNIIALEKKVHGVNRILPRRILKTNDMPQGYLRVELRKDGKRKPEYVHRIIAEAFIPNPDNKPQVNHINSDRKDNRVENLEGCTSHENCIHGYKHGNAKPVGRKLTDQQVKEIRESYALEQKKTYKSLSNEYGVSSYVIQSIISGWTYR